MQVHPNAFESEELLDALKEDKQKEGDQERGNDVESTGSVREEWNYEPSYKMVFVVNMDLKMGIGKIAAQVSNFLFDTFLIFIDFYLVGV